MTGFGRSGLILRGKVGEPVTIMVKRTGWTAAKPFTIIRGRIKIDPVKGEMLEGDDIGYLKIQSFHKNVADDMNAFLKKMEKQANGNPNGLVLDLRNNPECYLHQAIKVSDRFLRNGVIVATVEGVESVHEKRIMLDQAIPSQIYRLWFWSMENSQSPAI